MARAWFEDLPTGSITEMLSQEDELKICGKVEALRGFLRAKRMKSDVMVAIDEVEGLMGFDEERVRKFGHQSCE